MSQNQDMDKDDFALLNYLIKTENISVMYFPHGKLYAIPANSVIDFLIDDLSEFPGTDLYVFIHCSYSLQVGIPFVTCDISLGFTANTAETMENISIRLDTQKHNQHQQMILSIMNSCAKKLIIQERNRGKYAIDSAIKSFATTREYS